MAHYGRRSAFKAAGVLGFGLAMPRGAVASDASDVLSFYVAGARFRRNVDVAEGGAVVLRWTIVGGRDACEVVEPNGQVLGYVPERLLDTLPPVERAEARIERHESHAVPWRRYLVAVRARRG